jgi:NADPH:quinone reductase-like Zn-dependent oxidoreductase
MIYIVPIHILFFNWLLRVVLGNIIIDVVAGVDVILDCMGASYYQRNLDSLNFDGRLFIIGFQGGVSTEVDLRALFGKRLTVQGIADSDHTFSFLHISICLYK